MGYQDILKLITPEFDQIVGNLGLELNKLRTGRADPSLIADTKVRCFEQEFSLKQLAVISASSSKDIIIQPWDESYIEPILSSLNSSSLGSATLAEKNLIKISLPPLTEEYRKNFLKVLSERLEEQRITIRKIRDRAWKELQEGERDGNVREDDKYRGKEELDKLVKKYNEKIEEMAERKRKEVME
jgi:ribosome recycling factor